MSVFEKLSAAFENRDVDAYIISWLMTASSSDIKPVQR